MDGLIKDLAYALRGLRRSPGVAALAIISLALGVGANTAMLGMVNGLIWNPLPVPEPERLTRLFEIKDGEFTTLSYKNFTDIEEQAGDVFEGLLLQRLEIFGLGVDEKTEVAYGELVSPSYFDTLKVQPAVGRTFTAAETEHVGSAPVAVISHDLWRRRFDLDPAVVDGSIHLNGSLFTVIGVADASFNGTKFGLGMDLWVPAPAWASAAGWSESWDQVRGNHSWSALGRLQPGVTQAQGDQRLEPVAARLIEADPEANRGLRLALMNELDGSIHPSVAGIPRLIGMLAIAASALVLLVACANVASMLYARALSRRREIGIRYALGVSRFRLLRQLLSESAVLACLGGALGIGIVSWRFQGLGLFLPSLPYRFAIDPAPDLRVVVIASTVSLLAAVVAGIAPALQASATSPLAAMSSRVDSAISSLRGRRGLSAVVVSMVALSFVSLVLTGLFLRSLNAVGSVNPGFESAHRVVASYDISLAGDPELTAVVHTRRLLETLGREGEVEAAAVSSLMPLGDRSSSSVVYANDRSYDELENGLSAWRASITDGYFDVMGTPLIAGRTFDSRDGADGARVMIVNQTLVSRLWPDGEAVGRRLRYNRNPSERTFEVVGVVEDNKYLFLNEQQLAAIYLPFDQSPRSFAVVIAKTRGNADAFLPSFERILLDATPGVPVLDAKTVESHVSSSMWIFHMGASIAAGLGILALLLSAAGLYGVMAYAVGERKRELAIRSALGAENGQLMTLVFSHGMRLTAIGAGVGLLIALGLGRLLSTVLFGVSPGDPMTLLGVMATLSVVTLVASLAPAISASRANPVETLRDS